MSTALWVKVGNRLAPADPVTEAMIAGVKQGGYVHTSAPRQPRNPKHHRLMMAILSKVVEHTWPRFADVDRLIKYLKMESRMVEVVTVKPSVVEIEYQSINFYSMDQASFKTLCDQWLHIICTDLMPGTDPEELLKEAA